MTAADGPGDGTAVDQHACASFPRDRTLAIENLDDHGFAVVGRSVTNGF